MKGPEIVHPSWFYVLIESNEVESGFSLDCWAFGLGSGPRGFFVVVACFCVGLGPCGHCFGLDTLLDVDHPKF